MRIRSIVPDFYKDESLGAVQRDTRLLYLGLSSMADKNGCLKLRPKTIRVEVFPYDVDVTPEVVQQWIDELVRAGLIQRYPDSETGDECLWICDFAKTQKLTAWEKKDSRPACPPPPHFCSTSAVLPSEERRGEERRGESLRGGDFRSTAEVLMKGMPEPTRFTKLYQALISTEKFPASVTEAHVAQAMQSAPNADPEDEQFIELCVLEASGLAGRCGAAMPWMGKVFKRVAERKWPHVEDGPAARRFETVRDREYIPGQEREEDDDS